MSRTMPISGGQSPTSPSTRPEYTALPLSHQTRRSIRTRRFWRTEWIGLRYGPAGHAGHHVSGGVVRTLRTTLVAPDIVAIHPYSNRGQAPDVHLDKAGNFERRHRH